MRPKGWRGGSKNRYRAIKDIRTTIDLGEEGRRHSEGRLRERAAGEREIGRDAGTRRDGETHADRARRESGDPGRRAHPAMDMGEEGRHSEGRLGGRAAGERRESGGPGRRAHAAAVCAVCVSSYLATYLPTYLSQTHPPTHTHTRKRRPWPAHTVYTRRGSEVDGAAGEVHEGDEGVDKRHERLPRDEQSN